MTNNQSRLVQSVNKKEKHLHNVNYYNIENKVRSFRMQEEFGPKKFIKPWRTGTKSQQQIPPKGQKKGFRGNTISKK